MNKIIVILILISYVFTSYAFIIPANAYSNSWTCKKCGVKYDFDPRDTDYMNSWIESHKAACWGDSYSGDSGSYSTSHRPSSVQGAMLLGGLAGGILGGLYGMAYAEPDMLAYAAAGAFLGSVAIGLLWIVSEE